MNHISKIIRDLNPQPHVGCPIDIDLMANHLSSNSYPMGVQSNGCLLASLKQIRSKHSPHSSEGQQIVEVVRSCHCDTAGIFATAFSEDGGTAEQ